MIRRTLHNPVETSRMKIGISVLAAVLAALVASQIAAAQFDAHSPSIRVAAR